MEEGYFYSFIRYRTLYNQQIFRLLAPYKILSDHFILPDYVTGQILCSQNRGLFVKIGGFDYYITYMDNSEVKYLYVIGLKQIQ